MTPFSQEEVNGLLSMINDGYAIKDKDMLVVNQPMKKTLIMFIDYLKETKFIKSSEIAKSIPTVTVETK
jgi:hypothetical protein